MTNKYKVNYTLKNPESSGQLSKLFSTKSAAKKWIENNKDTLYWHQLVHLRPRSKLPKPIIQAEIPLDKYDKKIGILETFHEQGMECIGLILYEHGPWDKANPKFDSSKPTDGRNFPFYKDYAGINMLADGQILELESGEKIGILKDREFAIEDGFRYSFYPQGFSSKELFDLFFYENVKATLYIPKKDSK